MIWYDEIWELQHTPKDYTVMLCGIYNEPGSMEPAIIIRAIIQSTNKDDTIINITLYAHDPTHREHPNSDEVLAKYQKQLLKLKNNIISYNQLISKNNKN